MAMNFPINPQDGDTYLEYVFNGAIQAWEIPAQESANTAKYFVSETTPNIASEGDQWYHPGIGSVFLYVQDIDSLQWVEVVSDRAKSALQVTVQSPLVDSGTQEAPVIGITVGSDGDSVAVGNDPRFYDARTPLDNSVTADKIVDAAISNVHISATAGIDQAKINGLVSDINSKADVDSPNLTGTPTAPTAATETSNTQIATTALVDAKIADKTYNTDEVSEGSTNLYFTQERAVASISGGNGIEVSNLGVISADTSVVATKSYVDATVSGLTWKPAVNLYSNSNISLTGASSSLTIDGHQLDPIVDGHRLLLAGQTDESQNGIYVYSDQGDGYTLTRAIDSDTIPELTDAAVYVVEGDTFGATAWVQTNHFITAYDEQLWEQFAGGAVYVGGTGIDITGNTVSIDSTTDLVPEGSTNLYFTNARALSATAAAYDPAGSANTAKTEANQYTDSAIAAANKVPLTISSTEISRLDGVTSNIQDQLNTKATTDDIATVQSAIQSLQQADMDIFKLNSNMVTASYSIPVGYNSMSAGPLTIADGVVVTVPDGSSWSIV